MEKQVRFTESDEDQKLIKEIEEYRKEHGLSSFIAAVRKLCGDALKIAKIQH